MVSEIHSFTRFHITLPLLYLSSINNEKSNARRTKQNKTIQYNTSKVRTLLGFRCIILISSYGHNLKPDKPPLVNRMLQTCHWILYGEQEIINNRYFLGENSNPNFPVALSISLTLAENSLFVLELTNPFNSPVIPFVSKVSTCLSKEPCQRSSSRF